MLFKYTALFFFLSLLDKLRRRHVITILLMKMSRLYRKMYAKCAISKYIFFLKSIYFFILSVIYFFRLYIFFLNVSLIGVQCRVALHDG